MKYLRQIATVAMKDVRAELRTKARYGEGG